MASDISGIKSGHSLATADLVAAGILALAYSCSLLDRMVMSLLLDTIKSSLRLDDVQVSLLAGTAFAICYMLFSFIFGSMADRRNRKTIIIVGIVLWSIATFSCGLATSFFALFISRMAVGVGEGSLSPSAYSMLGDQVAPQRRGLAMSIFATGGTFGGGIGILISGALIGWAAGLIGSLRIEHLQPWQFVFMLVGLPGIIVAVLIGLFIREPVRTHSTHQGTSWAELGRQFLHHRGAYAAMFVGYAILAIPGYGFLVWGPSAFTRVHHLLPYQVGLLFGLGFAGGGTLGVFLGGALTDRLRRSRPLDAPFLVSIGSALVQILFFLIAYLSTNFAIAAVAMCLGIAAASMLGGLQAVMIQALVPPHMRGKASAVYTSAVNIVGMGLAPTLVALLSGMLQAGASGISQALAIMSALTLTVGAILLGGALPAARILAAENGGR